MLGDEVENFISWGIELKNLFREEMYPRLPTLAN